MTHYHTSLKILGKAMPANQDCLDKLECIESTNNRWAICFVNQDNDSSYWIDTYETPDDALTDIEENLEDKWLPIYLVDLHDLSAREISLEIQIGLGELI